MFIPAGVTASSIGDLLDHFPTSVHSAFSVRRFNSYTGFAARIRRTTDDVEADLYYDDTGDLSFDSPVSNFSASSSSTNLGEFMSVDGYTDQDSVGDTASRVVTWKDQSGNGRDVTNATEAYQPLLFNIDTLTAQNGVTAFDFASDMLQHSDASSYSQPNTYIAVVQSDGTSGNVYFTDGDGSGGRQLMTHSSNYKQLWAAAFGASSDASDTDQHLWFCVFDGTNSNMHIDGGSNVMTGNAGTQAQSGLTIGARYSGSNAWNGRIQEIIYYTGDHEATRAGMEFDVNRYYSIY